MIESVRSDVEVNVLAETIMADVAKKAEGWSSVDYLRLLVSLDSYVEGELDAMKEICLKEAENKGL